MASTLKKVSRKLPESEKELANGLLVAYAAGEAVEGKLLVPK